MENSNFITAGELRYDLVNYGILISIITFFLIFVIDKKWAKEVIKWEKLDIPLTFLITIFVLSFILIYFSNCNIPTYVINSISLFLILVISKKKYDFPPFFIIILLFLLIGTYVMSYAFNEGEWGFRENTQISQKIDDWADFATCLTALFALISIYLAYRAFMGQVNASRRASFDATFTQIFAQHNTLRTRVTNYKIFTSNETNPNETNPNEINPNETNSNETNSNETNSNETTIFTRCKKEFAQKGNQTVFDFWEHFNKKVIKNKVSVDFKNFFKYIYHEVTFVANQADEVLNEKAKEQYIQLVQAQMNNDELFCYLINQIAHYNKANKNSSREECRRVEDFAETLKKYDFFREICQYINDEEKNKEGIYLFVKELHDNNNTTNIDKFINKKHIN